MIVVNVIALVALELRVAGESLQYSRCLDKYRQAWAPGRVPWSKRASAQGWDAKLFFLRKCYWARDRTGSRTCPAFIAQTGKPEPKDDP